MRAANFRCILFLAGFAGCLRAAEESPSADIRKAMAESLEQQRQAVSQMEGSLETQRQTVRKQTPSTSAAAQSFFVSAPPAPSPGVSWAPASGVVLPAGANCDPLPVATVDSLIGTAAQREDLDPGLLRGVMQQESAFRPCAVSPKGAMGLMQLMPATAAQFNVRDPFDPHQSVDAGARLLKQLLNMYGGDVPLALGAYNAGTARVNEANGVPPIPETLDYVRRVLTLLPGLQ